MRLFFVSSTHSLLSDDNDNAPVFDKSTYEFRIDDTIEKNTVIGTVHASDRDLADNARITWGAIKMDSATAEGGVSFLGEPMINDTLKIIISYETVTKPTLRKLYRLTVVATDNGEVPR